MNEAKEQDFDKQWKKIVNDKEKMKKAFAVPLSFSRIYKVKDKMSSQLKAILANSLRKPIYEFTKKENSQSLLFFGMGTSKRQDHLSGFEKVADIAQPCDVQRPTGVHGKTSLLYFLQSALALIVSVPFALYNDWNPREWFYSVPHYIAAWHFKKFAKQVDFTKYKLVVVFFDTDTCSNILVQLAKENGCKTATLMHGIYVAPQIKPTTPFEDGVNFRGFVSDYLLAWNEYDCDQAIKSGINKNKIVVVGSQKFIDIEAPKEHNTTNIFGVILGWDQDKANRRLIEIANDVAGRLGKTYYLKYHPIYKGDEYNSCVTKACMGNINEETSLQEYISKTDFSLVGNSAMFSELLYLNHPTYHLHLNDEFDGYSDCEEFCFATVGELVELIEKKIDMQIDVSQEYITGPHDVRKRYENFFNMFIDSE